MKNATVPAAVQSAERVLRLTWLIVAGAMIFSVITGTPLVQRVTPDRWDKTAWILPVVVDVAVIIVVRMDAIIARLGVDDRQDKGINWASVMRWLSGVMTLLLNTGDSALKGDMVGVAVHSFAPLLLIGSAEVGIYGRRRILARLARIEADEQAAQERSRLAHEAEQRAEAERAEAERQKAKDEERAAAEWAADQERQQREHEAKLAQEQRDHAAQLAREADERRLALMREEEARAERERAREQEARDRERREQEERERAERERQERERREAEEEAARERERLREQVVSGPRAVEPDDDKLGEAAARAFVERALDAGMTQREMVKATGWSAGWIAARCAEHKNAA